MIDFPINPFPQTLLLPAQGWKAVFFVLGTLKGLSPASNLIIRFAYRY